ncbi:hypothetical protein BU24DRAFT_421650 [Aaosphaeria arxii CBS 175.79]|uniref:Acyl-CoA dehydrogenase/oxidase C-terminal n=1 Tax=Aaosphaeria arxii CBS 175.79 TaxID=1450172 RepID=A0A6A5XR98_9PLEO|nr:uncharacterized protein BU24DRAFT_421650 [Aaosphaeria arxii CBS 175.79]KAF2015357.1 hypothetical protein BU24DRAFT_421650 [Aaosphaeria arxii CBS 175.79]
MSSQPPTASSSTLGFFQSLPVLPPQYTSTQTKDATLTSDDQVFARILALYLPSNSGAVKDHIHHLARVALHPTVLAHGVDAETNHPTIRSLTTFGEENRNDPLWTARGWSALKEIGYKEGVIAVAFEKEQQQWNRRIYQFGLGHVWINSATMTGCPMSMTDGAAVLLSRHLNDEDGDQPGRQHVVQESFRRLTSRDPAIAWTSGQWMTERSGGSDVSGTETVSRRLTPQELAQEEKDGRAQDAAGLPLGPWRIDGFKWFSSATDSDMSVMLARTSKGGLSAFYAPLRRRTGVTIPSINAVEQDTYATELNGIRIQRLKNKLGTKSLPTAELELKGTRAWLIGEEGKGVKEISAILNITRLYTAAGSVGNWARGLAICRAYSKVRKVRGGLLQDNAQHLRWMADETVKFAAAMHFTWIGVALQGALEQDWDQMVRGTKAEGLIPKDKVVVQELLRFVLPAAKAQVSVASVHGLRQCMECLGGVGYCENLEDGGVLNIAKTYRDNLVNPIWEGTVSVMAEDVVRVLGDKRIGGGDVVANVFAPWVRNIIKSCSGAFKNEVAVIETRLESLISLVNKADKEELLYRGRELLDHIEVIVSGAVLIYDATINRDDVASVIASRWIASRDPTSQSRSSQNWKEDVVLDRKIFLGNEAAPRQKL